ncbi:MAG: GntR family transcriptional regulator [Chthoniobacterales bacterium]|nr:GntR family transcriptional regulator [Chthoniobacterales bacterium]
MDSTPPPTGRRYEEIAREVRGELLAGRYGDEGRMPSEAQLVRRYKVSRPTVARALRLLQDEGFVERRAGSGTYAKVRDETSRLRAKRLLALLMPDLGNTEIFQLIGGEIASLARVNDYTLAWDAISKIKPKAESGAKYAAELCQQFINQGVSGVFFAPFELMPEKEATNRELAIKLREAGISVVLLDRDVTVFPTRSDFDLVGVDNFLGGYLVAEHLLKLGCQRLCYVARPHSAPTVEMRISGMHEALRHRRVSVEPLAVQIGDLSDKRFVRNLISPLPDAFLCANDHTAALLLRRLHEGNIRVPEQVRVVGFDDVKFATLVSPPLTTVQQPWHELASNAFHAMLSRLDQPTLPPRHFMSTPRLIVRDSCGAYHPSTSQ